MTIWITGGIRKIIGRLMTLPIQKCLLKSLRVSSKLLKLEELEPVLVRGPTPAPVDAIAKSIKAISSYLTRRINDQTKKIKGYWVALG